MAASPQDKLEPTFGQKAHGDRNSPSIFNNEENPIVNLTICEKNTDMGTDE